MKAICLWQPWATLVAEGIKSTETRSWATDYQGPLAIHAAKYSDGGIEVRVLNDLEIGCGLKVWQFATPERMPRGAVIAVVHLAACVPVERMKKLTRAQRFCGDYTPGRFAWILEDIRKLKMPFPCRGRQGIFNVEIPKEFLP